MDHEHKQSRESAPTATKTPAITVEPGQSSRSAALRKPEHAIASGLVQRKQRDEQSANDIHAFATEGITGVGSSLPFFDQIQRSFGGHSVANVRAHIDNQATAACHGMGAKAYATGDHVAFHEPPDLHTAAHEAAHVVQQRAGVQLAGGVGKAGDDYERNADQVADAVVAGRSAEALLSTTGRRDQIERTDEVGQGHAAHAAPGLVSKVDPSTQKKTENRDGGDQAKASCPKCGSRTCDCAKSSGPTASGTVQRDEFVGGPGATASDRERPLNTVPGTLPPTNMPGGRLILRSASTAQNCAGDSIGVNRWVNWPNLGRHTADGVARPGLTANWEAAKEFVPSGCTRVSNDGATVNSSRCNSSGELEIIAFLYRWPIGVFEDSATQQSIIVYQSDFHMIGRSVASLPCGWHSKMDRRERVEDIRDPEQSLHDAYPHTQQPDREIVRLTFCGTQGAIRTA